MSGNNLKLFGPCCTSREYSPAAIRRRNRFRHEGHLLSGKTRVMVAGGGDGVVNMEVMSGWARQLLPQFIALLRIMTYPQPILERGHLHLHLLIFHARRWVFAMRIDNVCASHARIQHDLSRPRALIHIGVYSNTYVNLSIGCRWTPDPV